MKGHVKRTMEVLEALGFTRHDDQFGRRKWSFTHAFQSEGDPPLKVWEGQSEAACIAVQQKAHAIVETGTSGPKMSKNVGRRKHRAVSTEPTVLELARQDRAEARREAATGREVGRRLADEIRHSQEIAALMQPGNGR